MRSLGYGVLLWLCSVVGVFAQTPLLVSHLGAEFRWDLQAYTEENAPESHVLTCGAVSVAVPMPATSIPIRDVVPGPGQYTCALYAQNSAGRQVEPDVPFPLFQSGYTPGSPFQLRVLAEPGEPEGPTVALTKTFLGFASNDSSGTTLQLTGVSTIGYTHLVVFEKHEGSPTTITTTDNLGSGSFTNLTKVNHGNGDISSQISWVKIGTPSASSTITMTLGAARPYRRLGVWAVNSGTGDIEVDASAQTSGSGATPDAGSLVTTAATVSFMGVGEYTGTTYTPSTGWTEDWDSASSFGGSRSDSSGTLDPSVTSFQSMDWTCNAVSFKETSGGTTYNESPSDSLTPTEALAKSIGKTRGDTLGATEAFLKSVNRSLAESVVLTEGFVKGVNRSLADSVSLTEDFLSTKVALRSYSDSLSATERFVKQLNRSVAESAVLTESRVLTVGKAFDESVGLSEGFTTLKARFLTLPDTLGVTEAFTKFFSKITGEYVTLTENLQSTKNHGAPVPVIARSTTAISLGIGIG